MKMKFELQPWPVTLDHFAKLNDLTMRVVEREDWQIRTGNSRYYAEFEGAEVKILNMLCGIYGNGDSFDEAIKDYIERILGDLLVINAADKEKRREIRVPKQLIMEWKYE